MASTAALEVLRRGYRASGLHPGFRLGAALAAAVGRHPDDPVTFLSGRTEQVTVGELFADAQRLAAVLRRDGLADGEVVGIQLANGRRAWTIYLAGLIAGAVLVPIVPTAGARDAAFCLSDAGARRFFVADRWRRTDYIAGLGPVRAAGSLRSITVVGDDVPSDCVAYADLERRMGGEPGRAAAGPGAGDGSADCFICYTSGSTARPKGARHTHDTFHAELIQARARWPDRQVVFTARPLGTMAGLLAVLRAMYLPAETYVMDRWDTPAALEVIRARNVTYLPTVPFMLTTVLDLLEREGSRLPSLQEVSCGGSSVPPPLIERADELGIRCYRQFGSTEHPTVTSGRPGEDLRDRASTDGRLLPGASLRVIDEAGRDVGPGDEGEIVTGGPDRFAGYRSAAANEAAFTADGWLRSGDLGYLTGSGHLVVTGRVKDLIIRAGVNLAPAAIEETLARLHGVAEVAVTGVADREYGEKAAAFVVLRPGAELTMDDVREHFERSGVARQKTPEYLVVKDAMPRTGSGKIAKRQLREELETELHAGEAAPAPRREGG